MIGVVSEIRTGQPWNRSSIPGRRKRSFFSPDQLIQLPVPTPPTIQNIRHGLCEFNLLLHTGHVKCTSARKNKLRNFNLAQ
jgi:hypothetical protein